MTTPGGKITFGNNANTTYSVNNTTFGKVSGDNVGGSYSPYSQLGNTTGTVSGYAAGQQQGVKSAVYQQGITGQTYGNTFTSGQTVTPVTTSFQNKSVSYGQPQTTKITFGGKQFSNSYTPVTRYQTSGYVPPAQYQSYQTYQSYQKPVEIQPVTQIQSQPIREEVNVEPKVEQAARVSNKGSKVQATPLVKESSVKKDKKGGCPAWLWPMLGILALLGLILGLLFGLGVFGRIGAGSNAGPNLQSNNNDNGVSTSSTSASAGVVNGTADSSSSSDSSGAPATGINSVDQGQGQQQQGGDGYTVIDQTVVVSKDNGTQGVTSPTSTTGTATQSAATTATTTGVTSPATTTTPTTTTATTSEDNFGVDPSGLTPAPATTTPSSPVYDPTSSTTTTPTSTYDYSTQPSSSPYYTASPYNTYPTTSTEGYGSNPAIDFVQPTSA